MFHRHKFHLSDLNVGEREREWGGPCAFQLSIQIPNFLQYVKITMAIKEAISIIKTPSLLFHQQHSHFNREK